MTATEAARTARSAEWEDAGGRVLRMTGSPHSRSQRLLVPILDQGGDASLGFLEAASWWGLRGCRENPPTIVTTDRSSRTTDLARVRRVRELPPRWSVLLRDVPVVRPELLALHLFVVCHPTRAASLVDRLWSRRLLSGPSIERFLADMGRSGRNGITPLRAYLEKRPENYVPPASGLEGRVQDILDAHGIAMRAQVDTGGENWTGRVDFRHPDLPFVLEVQSEAHHKALTDQEHDARRRKQLVADGFTYDEVWDTDVWARPWIVVDKVRAGIEAARGGFVR